jgi:hypothetical protein
MQVYTNSVNYAREANRLLTYCVFRKVEGICYEN